MALPVEGAKRADDKQFIEGEAQSERMRRAEQGGSTGFAG
jgi:hypothetical protein